MHNRKGSKKKTNKPQRKQPKRGAVAFPLQKNFSASRAFPLVAPDQMDVPLRFRYQGTLYGFGSIFSRRFTPNAAYDVDPVLGSTETYGFDEYAALYSYYRVVSYKYRIQVSNLNNTQPCYFYVLNTNTDPTLVGSRFDLYSTNPYCFTRLLGPNPAPHATTTVSKGISCSQLLGAPVIETEDNFRAATNGVPADLLWLTVAGEAPTVTGGDGVVNLLIQVDITMNTRFYSRKVDLSISGIASYAANAQKMLHDREAYTLTKKQGKLPWQQKSLKQ